MPRLRDGCLWLLALSLAGCPSPSAPPPQGKPLQAEWSVPLASTDSPLVRDGRVYVRGFPAGQPRTASHLYALDASSGQQLWVSELVTPSIDEGPARGRPMQASADGYLIVPQAEAVYVVNASNGKLVRRCAANQPPLLDEKTHKLQAATPPGRCWDGIFYSVDKNRQLSALDLKTRKVLWNRATPALPAQQAAVESWQIFVADHQLWVVGRHSVSADMRTQDSILACHDRLSGKPAWSYLVPDHRELKEVVKADRDQLWMNVVEVVPDKHQLPVPTPTLQLLDAASGKPGWRFAPFDRLVQVSDEEVWISAFDSFRGGSPDFNAALDRSSGKEKWRHPRPVLGVASGDLVWEAHHRAQADLGREWTGDKKGQKLPGGIQAPAEVHHGTLQGYAPRSGAIVWQSPTFPTTAMSQPVVEGKRIFVSSVSEMQGGRSAVSAYSLPPP